uniref:Uncharacterized protein n=1 Tax=Desulfovibrio sp. U5L TaxID=596152 RepID=I2Q2N4_9BACT
MADFNERPDYEVSEDAAIILEYGTTNQAVVKGLTKLGLPSLTRSTTTISAFRTQADIDIATSAKYGTITFSGNEVATDLAGQRQLKQYLKNKTRIQNCRVYRNMEDFLTVDLANDRKAALQVTKYSPGSVDKNGVWSFDGEMICSGQVATFLVHMTASTIAFVAEDNTVTDTGNGFVEAGFLTGQTLIVEGAPGNNGQYLIKAVAPGVLTLDSATSVVAAVVGTEVTLHGGEL